MKTHGKSGTAVYKQWILMVRRCHAPESDNYKYYGARGIAVCSLWRESLEEYEFYIAQLPHYGEAGYSLDRIDNDGNYEPGNVRFSTMSEQLRNTRRTRLFTFAGKTQCVTAWSEELGIPVTTLYQRLTSGWSVEEMFSTPIYEKGMGTRRSRMITYQGITKCLLAWSEQYGVRYTTLIQRLDNGWTVERALTTPGQKPIKKQPTREESASENGTVNFTGHAGGA